MSIEEAIRHYTTLRCSTRVETPKGFGIVVGTDGGAREKAPPKAKVLLEAAPPGASPEWFLCSELTTAPEQVGPLDPAPTPPARQPYPLVPALPTSPEERKARPIVRGCIDYFPAALAAVANLSKVGNDQHNPGQPMHHARGKSTDHADCIVRHLIDRGTVDTDGIRHSAKVAWRALAMLQEELEREEGAPLPRGAKL